VGADEKEDVFEKLEKKQEFDYRKDYPIVRAVDFLKGMLVLKDNR